jgi:hypothetical protein
MTGNFAISLVGRPAEVGSCNPQLRRRSPRPRGLVEGGNSGKVGSERGLSGESRLTLLLDLSSEPQSNNKHMILLEFLQWRNGRGLGLALVVGQPIF